MLIEDDAFVLSLRRFVKIHGGKSCRLRSFLREVLVLASSAVQKDTYWSLSKTCKQGFFYFFYLTQVPECRNT